MSNAIAQSATQLSTSLNGEENFSIPDSVRRQAEYTVKGTTRERQLLNRNKLISKCVEDYRMHFPQIYGKTEKLPRDLFNKIEAAVDEFLTAQFSRVNSINALSLRRSFYHNFKQSEVTERIQIMGENKLTMQEQLFGITQYIAAAERRLKELYAKPTPDFDREKAIKANLMQCELTKQFIQGELANQKEVVTPAP